MQTSKLTARKRTAKKEGWLRWIRSEADERAVLNGCRFEEPLGDHVVTFFSRYLRHSKGKWAGKPFELLDWERDGLIKPLFGWVKPNGFRRFNRSFCFLPKKNGKSTLGAGVGLYGLAGDGEMGAEVYSAATDRKQAGIVHGEAVHMVEASEDLEALLSINHSSQTISLEATRSFYRILSKESRSSEGLNIHVAICDEVHAWYGRKLWDALRYGIANRDQPLIFVITTAGDDTETICHEQYEYAQGVLAGHIHDDGYFALIYEAAADDDWTDPKVWRKANPSLGVTISESGFRDDVKEAKKKPSSVNALRRYRLNVWCTTEQVWLSIDDWQKCREDFSPEELEGRECWAGLDLSKTRDLTALVLVFGDVTGVTGEESSEVVRLLPFFWLPEERAKELNHVVPFLAWAEQGYVELTPGNVVDYGRVLKRLEEISQRFHIRELAFDPYNAEELTQRVEAELGIPRVAFGQTIGNFAEPTAEFERRVVAGSMRHNGHPVMAWQASHCQVKSDANKNIRPVKRKHGDPKTIDGIVGGVMGLGRYLAAEDESGPLLELL